MKLFYGFILMFAAQILTFIQLQGQMKWDFVKNNPYIIMFLGLPISLMFMHSTRLFYDHFQINWPGRLVGQGVGIVMFSIMSWYMFREPLTLKTIVCIILAMVIVMIQMFWK